jgi:site-specific DNA-methyltransferase (adenine-specific)
MAARLKLFTMIELLHIDCMEYMATLPDKAFELAVVDPPYGIKEPAFRRNDKNAPSKKATKTKEYNVAVFNQDVPSDEYFDELFRVSNNQIIWGGNYFGLRASRCWIVWDKVTYDAQWADGELAWTSFKSSVRIFQFAWNGMIQGDMKNKEVRIHPTQKPKQLYKWLLREFAQHGDRILDTHGGSRSLAIACHEMGFDHVSCELDDDYHRDSVKRYENAIKQQRLFT